jgi:hypothetical protein
MTEGVTSRRMCVILILEESIVLAEHEPWPVQSFSIDGETYREIGLGEWTGFYDWLRDRSGNVIGVRYSSFKDIPGLIEAARTLDYVVVRSSRSLEIFLADKRESDEQHSADQEFQYDAVFHSATGRWALAFDTSALSATERDALRATVEKTVTLQDVSS